MLLTHPSALRFSREGCKALHVPTGGREAGGGRCCQYQVPFAAQRGKDTSSGPSRAQAPGPAPALLQLTVPRGRQT